MLAVQDNFKVIAAFCGPNMKLNDEAKSLSPLTREHTPCLMCQVREGMWIPVGSSFVSEGVNSARSQVTFTTKKGSWYQRHGPEAEWKT